MKKVINRITIVFLFLMQFVSQAQTVVINELITSNSTVITDNDGTYEDWIELYNPTTQPINLNGYGLTDNPAMPHKWIFPEYWMQPGEHLLIWCTDKNRVDPTQPLHTNFKISSGGEEIVLTSNTNVLIDSYPAVTIPQNHSYGRTTDGATTFMTFTTPTPGTTNNPNQDNVETLTEPVFSINSGFFTSNVTLTLSHPDPQVTIIYTLDGSDPEINNITGTTYQYKNSYAQLPGQTGGEFLEKSFNSFQYTEQLTITNRTSEPNDISMISSTFDLQPNYFPNYNIEKATVVRARAYKNGANPSKIVSNTYFVNPDGLSRYTLPVISISVNEDELFDFNKGIYVAGQDFETWRENYPDTPAQYNAKSNWDRRGDETEKRGNINYFVNGVEVLNQELGIRINGGNSRELRSKSLRLYARSEYGKSTFDYPFFDDEEFTQYKRLVLRNSGQDFHNTLYKDGYIHNLVRDLSPDTRGTQPAIVFLNGEYWGILNIRERYDKYYFEQTYGIHEDDLDFLKDDLSPEEGTNTDFLSMMTYMRNNDMNIASNYDYINTLIDTQNFKDYFITNIFIQNTDWPGWNTVFWRKNTTFSPNAPLGHDGRWRTAINDTDASFSLMYDVNNHNTLQFATATDGPEWPNPEWSTLILRKLLDNQNFKLEFITRFADLMNTHFLPAHVIEKSNFFKNRIEPEARTHINRWKRPSGYTWWNTSSTIIQTFASERPAFQREHIREKFDIDGDINVTLQVDNIEHGYVKINTINIIPTTPGVPSVPYPWTGIYFQNIPVTLTAVPLPGFQFSHWSGASASTSPTITVTSSTNIDLTAHFTPTEVIVDTKVPIHFWLFDNNISIDTPLTQMEATYSLTENAQLNYQSALVGYPFSSNHSHWRKASMEKINKPTQINYIPQSNNDIPFPDVNMRGIQIKQPFEEGTNQNTLIFNLPTTDYKDILFAFAAQDEGAASGIILDYSVNPTTTWTTAGINSIVPLTHTYNLFQTNFEAIEATNNNPHFKVRLRFYGSNLTADNGDRVIFNNISTTGNRITMNTVQPINQNLTVYPNPTAENLYIAHPAIEAMSYKIYSIDGKLINQNTVQNGTISVNTLQNGMYLLEITSQGKSYTTKFVKK
jgi:hypothetical protein